MPRLLSAAIVLLAAACQTAQMRVAPPLAAVTPLQVQGANPRLWNRPVRFGSWETSTVREGLTWGFAERLLGIEAAFRFQPYRLVVAAGERSVQAECITRALALSKNGFSIDPSLGRIPTLACAFHGPGEGTLRLRTTASGGEEGEIVFGGMTWAVRGVRELEGSRIRSADLLGYEISRAGEVVAAVETINRGRVWLSPSLAAEDETRLAAVATALLLYERPDPE